MRLALALLICSITCFAQVEITGIVVHEKTGSPLSFVNVVDKQAHNGTISDIDGRFKIGSQPGSILEFRYIGFESYNFSVPGTSGTVVIRLKEKPTELQEIIIRPENNPALRIIAKVIENKSSNDPYNLPSFRYQSYNKLSCALQPVGSYSRNGKDSTRVKKFVENNVAFLSESYTEKKYVKPDKHKEVVLGNRFSGIRDPFFAFLATDLQPFGFYKDLIPLLGKNYSNPIASGSLDRYDYTLMDTIFHSPDTVYVIRFEPLEGKKFEGLQGQLYVTTDGYALTHVLARPSDEHQLMETRIQQEYEKHDGHWFPVVLNSELIFNSYEMRNLRPYYYSRSYLSEIHIGEKIDKKDFDLLNVSFAPDANRQEDAFWESHRLDSLSRKEVNTYARYDSGKQMKAFNTMMKIAEGFVVGKFRMGKFYLPTEYMVKFNQYESIRLGIGLQTAESISKLFNLEGYAGYGFKDAALKYGGGLQLNLINRKEGRFRFRYRQDLIEPGNSYFIKSPAIAGNETFRHWLAARMDSLQELQADFFIRPFPHSQLQVYVQEQKRNPTYAYSFQPGTDVSYSRNQFTTSTVGVQWRYGSNETFTQIGNSKVVTERANPQLQLAASRSFSGLANGEYDFTKAEFQLDHYFNWGGGARTTYQLSAGYSWGDIPYPYLYNVKGTLYQGTVSQGFFIQNYFQTVDLYEFVSDRFAYLFLQHNFGRLTGTGSKYFRPELSLLQNSGWGSLAHPEYHKDVSIKTMERGLFESGLMLTNIFRIKYMNMLYYGIGGGAFYRYGPNALASFSDNLAWKIFINVSF